MTKKSFTNKFIVLLLTCVLGACSKEKSVESLKEVSNAAQLEGINPEPFTHRHLEDYVHKVGYEMEQFFVNDYLNLVVNPSELNRFETEIEGVIEVSFDLVEEFMSGTHYLSLDGIRIHFGAVEPLIPIYEDYKGSEREVGKLELNQEDLNKLNWSDEKEVKKQLKEVLIMY